MHSAHTPPPTVLTPLRIAFFATVVGIFIFNVFAAQVLVGSIAKDLGLGAHGSLVPTFTVLGYALGLLLIVPLADVVENRRLAVAMGVACAGSLLAAALTHQPVVFIGLCFVSGAASSLIQILVPLVGALAPAAHRGRVLGNVMSGLMLGIMLSRPLSSLVGEHFGWRAVYLLAALLASAALVPLQVFLPQRKPTSRVRYGAALRSMATLLRREPILRSNSLTAALGMGAFNAFWTAIAARLTSTPFQLSARELALFGLVGMTGSIAAPVMGRLGDRGATRVASLITGSAVIAAFLLALWGGQHASSAALGVAALVAAAVLLDFGVIGDQTLGRRAINMLDPAAIGRRNGVFVGLFFLGGAAGSALVGPAQAAAGWSGVCLVGMLFGVAALLASVFFGRVALPVKAPGDGLELSGNEPRLVGPSPSR